MVDLEPGVNETEGLQGHWKLEIPRAFFFFETEE